MMYFSVGCRIFSSGGRPTEYIIVRLNVMMNYNGYKKKGDRKNVNKRFYLKGYNWV